MKALRKICAWAASLICCLFLADSPLFPQQKREIELTAQEILARVDRVLGYPRGLLKGKLMHILPDGTSSLVYISGKIAESDFLFSFSSRERGEEMRVLYNLGGEDIWVYDTLAIRLFRKMDKDKYDPILATNYSFIDLSNADLQSNYSGVITGDAVVKAQDAYKLRLEPIFKGGVYGLLTLYASKKDFVPLRIDYHDQDRVIFKSLSVVKVIERNNRIIPVRFDMLDLRRGTLTILELYGFDESAVFDKSVFFHQRLGDKG